MTKIRAVFPAGENNCGQLAQAPFSHDHCGTGGKKSWSKGINWVMPHLAHS
jgi:hypothetical protein